MLGVVSLHQPSHAVDELTELGGKIVQRVEGWLRRLETLIPLHQGSQNMLE
ncbi:MAG: hypothetical protein R3B96_12870 [Pirellulaceae bacterium]